MSLPLGQIQKSSVWLKGLIRPFRSHAVLAVFLGVVALCFSSLLMFTSGFLISKTASANTTLFMVMVPVAFVQLFGIGRPIARYFERLVSHDWVFRVTSRLRVMLFHGIADKDAKKQGRSSGDYLDMLTSDIGYLQNMYLRVAFPTIVVFVAYLFALVFSGFFSVRICAVIGACVISTLLMIPLATYMGTLRIQEHAKALRSSEFASLTDDVMGSVDWTLAGRQGDALAKHVESLSMLCKADSAWRHRVRLFELASTALLGLTACGIALAAGLTFEGDGELVHYASAFSLGFFPLAEMAALLPGAAAECKAQSDAVLRLSDTTAQHNCAHDLHEIANELEQRATISDVAVNLVNVRFRYERESAFFIDNVTLSIPHGQKVAVIGRSGSGKTTLASIIRKTLIPDTGDVKIGAPDNWMMDICDKCLVCYIPQMPYVFDCTIHENLAFANPDANDEELVAALSKVGLSSWFASQDHGLDTEIGETGIGQSGGEAHRLAIARALIAPSPIILLDEPFAEVDPKTEHLLLDTLFDVFENRTVIVITHHLAAIDRFDRVICMEDGHIEKDASPRALMQDDAWFINLMTLDSGLTSQQLLAQ